MSPARFLSASRPRLARLRLILAAGFRLAGLYTGGVLVVLLGLMLWSGEWVGNVYGVLMLDGWLGAFLLSATFLALVALRRAGIVVCWLALLLVWCLRPLRWIPIGILSGFVWWSVLALPLYVLTIVGLPPSDSPRIRGSHVVGAGWVALLAVTLVVTPAPHLFLASVVDGAFGAPPAAFLRFVPWVWNPIPLVITAHAIFRVAQDRRSAADICASGV